MNERVTFGDVIEGTDAGSANARAAAAAEVESAAIPRCSRQR